MKVQFNFKTLNSKHAISAKNRLKICSLRKFVSLATPTSAINVTIKILFHLKPNNVARSFDKVIVLFLSLILRNILYGVLFQLFLCLNQIQRQSKTQAFHLNKSDYLSNHLYNLQ